VRIAYIISAYKLPDLLVRLVRRLDAPGTATYIHVDARTREATYRAMTEPLRGRPSVHFLPRHACRWGDFGHVAATLKGLRALVGSGQPFDYVVLLTGQDYPLRPNPEIAATLRRAGGQVFMDWMPIPNGKWTGGGTDRIEHWHFRVAGRLLPFPGAPFRHRWLNTAWSLPARLFRPQRRFPAGLRPFGGSSYWMMPADCARYVDAFVCSNPGYVRFFRRVLVPDEIFFQTIVLNSPFRHRIAPDDLRYVAWEGDGDHPKTLTMEDFDALMGSPKLFARKFDPQVDQAVLDRIDGVLTAAE
jgi:hypothetical protein